MLLAGRGCTDDRARGDPRRPAALEELWRAFEAEVPPPAHEDVDEATELGRDPRDRRVRARLGRRAGRRRRRDGARPASWRRASGGSPTSTSSRRRAAAASPRRSCGGRGAGSRPTGRDGRPRGDGVQRGGPHRLRAWGFREEVPSLAAPVAALAERLGEAETRAVVRLDPRPDRRRRRDPEGGRDARAPASGPLDRLDRDPAARRLRDRLRRRLRPRPGDAAAAREGDLVAHRASSCGRSASSRARSCG